MPDLKTELAKVTSTPAPKPVTRQGSPHNRMTTTPFFIKKLAEKVGSYSEASRMIGYGASSIQTSLTRDTVSVVAELAAKGVLAELEAKDGTGKSGPKEIFAACRIPADKLQAFTAVAEAMGINLKRLD